MLEAWLDTAEAMLTAPLTMQTQGEVSHSTLALQQRKEQENLLGAVIAWRAFLRSYQEGGQTALALSQRALALLSAQNYLVRAQVGMTQLNASYTSSANDAVAAVQSGLQALSLVQAAGQPTLAITAIGAIVMYMIGAGRLHEAQQLNQQAIVLGRQSGELVLSEVGYPTAFQAEILREWNELDAALSLAQEAISLCKQAGSIASLPFLLLGYTVLLRISLSRRELDTAYAALQQLERIGMSMEQHICAYHRSFFTTIDQVRLWLAYGELDRATCWAEELDLKERHGTPFAHERKEVARVRVFLAMSQPVVALQRLESVLPRATAGQRWGHVIEMRLLQALAYEMLQQETEALSTLSEAVHLAEPEGYIRSFVDEGPPMAALLSRLRQEQSQLGPTSYLDTVLAAFPQQSQTQEQSPKQVTEQATEHATAQLLPDPLSERELQVLQLLAQGASNQDIAQELVVVVTTIKRHVSHIFFKLGAKNRLQAVRKAQELGLLDEEF